MFIPIVYTKLSAQKQYTSKFHVKLTNLEVFSRRNKHDSKHGKWYSAQRLEKKKNSSCPAKNPNNKTESGNPEYSKIQTQSGKILYNIKLAITV